MMLKEYFERYGEILFIDDLRGIKFNSDGVSRVGGRFKVKDFRKNNKSVV